MKKVFSIIIGLILLILAACGGGGNGTAPEGTNQDIGFTTEDFSGKSIYLVDEAGYSLGIFYEDSSLRAYEPNQNYWYQQGTWTVTDGKLVVAGKEYPERKIIYTLLNDDKEERYFKVSRLDANGEVEIIGMFYDQVTGFSQAQNFKEE